MRRMISGTPVAHGEYDKTNLRFVLDRGLRQNAFYMVVVSYTSAGELHNVVGFLDTTLTGAQTSNKTTPMTLYTDTDSQPVCLEFQNYADERANQFIYGYTADYDQYKIKVIRLA